MARLIVSNLVSIDGYCAGPGGNPAALPMDAAFDAYNAERLRAAGALLFGRTTFSMFSAYWPQVAQDAAARPVLREIAALNGALQKVVVSETLQIDPSAPWGDSEVVRRHALRARVAALKQQVAGDLLVFGSHVLWNELLAQGLVDELHLLVAPVMLGAGVRAFERAGAATPRLLQQRRLDGSETVLLQYGCGGEA